MREQRSGWWIAIAWSAVLCALFCLLFGQLVVPPKGPPSSLDWSREVEVDPGSTRSQDPVIELLDPSEFGISAMSLDVHTHASAVGDFGEKLVPPVVPVLFDRALTNARGEVVLAGRQTVSWCCG